MKTKFNVGDCVSWDVIWFVITEIYIDSDSIKYRGNLYGKPLEYSRLYDEKCLSEYVPFVAIELSYQHAKILHAILGKTSTSSWNNYVESVSEAYGTTLPLNAKNGNPDYIYDVYTILDKALTNEN